MSQELMPPEDAAALVAQRRPSTIQVSTPCAAYAVLTGYRVSIEEHYTKPGQLVLAVPGDAALLVQRFQTILDGLSRQLARERGRAARKERT